ncbi:MAG: NYN domain-containing protein [bacterium]|nr:NYN domain-containing protein [bacterium]
MQNREEQLYNRMIEIARQTLREMDGPDRPGVLRKVNAHTGLGLPPPRFKVLKEYVDQNEWFRDLVAEDFEGSTDDNDPYEQVAAYFILRPEGWEQRVEDIRRDLRDADQTDRIRVLEAENKKLVGERKKLMRGERKARSRADKAEAQADKRVEQAWEEARENLPSELVQERDQQATEIRHLKRELEDQAAELDEVRRQLDSTRADLERERKIDHSPPTRSALPNIWAELDEVEAAQHLDDVVRRLFTGTLPSAPEPPAVIHPPLVLPDGVSPDSREAMEWLINLGTPFNLLVDGYNVTAKMYPPEDWPDRFSRPEIRDRLHGDLSRFRVRARMVPRVTVIWDSKEGSDRDGDVLQTGVEVKFTSEGREADDDIIDDARKLGASAVVVSSDGRVLQGAQAAGALGIKSEALVDWALGSTVHLVTKESPQ